MSTATVLNSSGTGFLVTNSVLNSAGTAFAVDDYALDSDGNPFLIFLTVVTKFLNTGGGADASDEQNKKDDGLIMTIIKAYMKHTI